jgi:hypothetical protein
MFIEIGEGHWVNPRHIVSVEYGADAKNDAVLTVTTVDGATHRAADIDAVVAMIDMARAGMVKYDLDSDVEDAA